MKTRRGFLSSIIAGAAPFCAVFRRPCSAGEQINAPHKPGGLTIGLTDGVHAFVSRGPYEFSRFEPTTLSRVTGDGDTPQRVLVFEVQCGELCAVTAFRTHEAFNTDLHVVMAGQVSGHFCEPSDFQSGLARAYAITRDRQPVL